MQIICTINLFCLERRQINVFQKKKKTFRRKQETFVVSEIPLWKSGSRNNSSDTFVNFSMEDGEIVVQNITFQKSMFVGRVMKECRRNEKVSRKFGSFKGS